MSREKVFISVPAEDEALAAEKIAEEILADTDYKRSAGR